MGYLQLGVGVEPGIDLGEADALVLDRLDRAFALADPGKDPLEDFWADDELRPAFIPGFLIARFFRISIGILFHTNSMKHAGGLEAKSILDYVGAKWTDWD